MDDGEWFNISLYIRAGGGSTFIQSCLDAGLDVNALKKCVRTMRMRPLSRTLECDITMLSHAAECGNMEVIEFLVQNGADGNITNSDGSKPLHFAAQCGHKNIVKFFLNLGICANSCDNNQCTPLHYIAAEMQSADRGNYQELVHILLDSNADLNAVNRKGCTPLLQAAQNLCKHAVELFIKLGANVDCCDEKQWTILHHSSFNGWPGIIRYLLEGRFDIDLNARNSNGETPLLLAATYEAWGLASMFTDSNAVCKDNVELFLKWGANIDYRYKDGRNILHYVCCKQWLDVVKCLVNKGCDLNAIDSSGCTLYSMLLNIQILVLLSFSSNPEPMLRVTMHMETQCYIVLVLEKVG